MIKITFPDGNQKEFESGVRFLSLNKIILHSIVHHL